MPGPRDKSSPRDSRGLPVWCLVILRRVSLGRFTYLTGISPRCNSELSETPAVKQCKLSFHLFPYFRCPRMAWKTKEHRRGDVCTQETQPRKKCWGQRWELNLSGSYCSSGSPQQLPHSSGSHPPAHCSFGWACTAHASQGAEQGFNFPFYESQNHRITEW